MDSGRRVAILLVGLWSAYLVSSSGMRDLVVENDFDEEKKFYEIGNTCHRRSCNSVNEYVREASSISSSFSFPSTTMGTT
jgi:hypothetical protein